MRWPSLRLHRAEPLSRLLAAHRAAHLAAAFTPGHQAEAEFHLRWIEAIEHGATPEQASTEAVKHLTGQS